METIEAAAIKVRDVVCFVERPGRHHNVFYAMARAGFDDRIGPEQQGFVTSDGRFVGRSEARKIADAAGQLIRSCKGPDGVPFVRDHPELFSEDVW